MSKDFQCGGCKKITKDSDKCKGCGQKMLNYKRKGVRKGK